jgi:hypothetical protein
MKLDERLVARLAPLVTVRRAALWSNVFIVVVVALAVFRMVTSVHPLADGDVGGDFRGFYYAGEYARTGQSAHLYDRIEEILRGGRVETPFMHPPIVALLFAPISLLPYPVALVAFLIASIGCWLAACAMVQKDLGDERASRELWLIVRFAPVAYSLAYGQMTALLAVPLALFIVSLRRSRDGTAGLALGLLAIKPQMLVGLLVYLALQRRFRAIITAIASGAVVSGASFVVFPEAARTYARVSGQMLGWSRIASARPWAQIGFFRLGTNTLDGVLPLLGTFAGVALTMAGFAWLVSIASKREETASRDWDLALAAIIPLSLCLSPYLFHYDAGLFVLAFMLVQHRLARRPMVVDSTYFTDARLAVAAFATGLFFALGPGLSEHAQTFLHASFGLQPAMLALIWLIFAVSRARVR